MPIEDARGRILSSLRISVTDRCNLRCHYCMPETGYAWLPHRDTLTFDETSTLVDLFCDLGVTRVRLTGGEPLLRHDLHELVRLLAAKPRLRDLALTTNGVLLARHAERLRMAGLTRVTVSLDTLRADRFRALTRFDALDAVLEGIAEAKRVFGAVKLDAVIVRGTNEDELVDLLEYAKTVNAELRYIEYMDVGGATHWSADKVMTRYDILRVLEARYGPAIPIVEDSTAPAERFALADGTVLGVISSTSAPFCRSCDRSRLTVDGLWYLCLYATRGTDLRQALRAGAAPDEVRELIAATWTGRADHGAEERLVTSARGPSIPVGDLHKDPHLEMHTRGG